jgi:hypothetical protein
MPTDRAERTAGHATAGPERPADKWVTQAGTTWGQICGGVKAIGSHPADITPGSDLLSRAVAREVPSALEGLTTVFGMGTGVTPPASPPGISQVGPYGPNDSAMARAFGSRLPVPMEALACDSEPRCKLHTATPKKVPSSPRPISTGRLKTLRPLHLRPINQVVFLGSYPVSPVGGLILGWASRLDAFSAYPVRT